MIILNLKNEMIYLKLSEDFNLSKVAKLKVQLFTILDQFKSIDMDLSEVKHMDVSGYQLLNLLTEEAEKNNKSITISSESSSIRDFVSLYKNKTFFQYRKNLN